MTRETFDEMPIVLQQYALPEDLNSVNISDLNIEIFSPGDELKVGNLTVATGHSGHVAGGVWMQIQSPTGERLIYSGDVVPNSSVYPMSSLPHCDLLLLDASYGIDAIPIEDRIESIRKWVGARPGSVLLPTPLSGRSIELINILPQNFAICEGMRESLLSQIFAIRDYNRQKSLQLEKLIRDAEVWRPETPFPVMPLLTYDGMGIGGPSVEGIQQAIDTKTPILCTGHLPPGSPGELAVKAGVADWLRFPTHPNLIENTEMWKSTGKPKVLGHSCPKSMLLDIGKHIHSLDPNATTGQSYRVTKERPACE